MIDVYGTNVFKKNVIMYYLRACKQGERKLVVKPVHLNFNYWKRTKKAGCATGLFYCFEGMLEQP
jgi:hypothetical protein